jgi:hypothetical protein
MLSEDICAQIKLKRYNKNNEKNWRKAKERGTYSTREGF